jgi:protein-disulfide isomerase
MIAKTFAAILLAAGVALAAVPAHAQEDQSLSPKQAEAVRKIIKDYLMQNPEVIGEAIEALREKMRVQAEVDAKKAIEARKDELTKNADDPVAGNPKGDITLVEFFDYNCGFCKQTYDGLWDAVKADGKVRVVLKEFPILGPDSVTAARIALVAKAQGKYDDVHRAFMKYRGRLDEKTAFRLAAEAGLKEDQLRKDISAPEIDKQLKRNMDLATALEIGGTPAFVVGDKVVQSALDQATLKQLFDVARKPKT